MRHKFLGIGEPGYHPWKKLKTVFSGLRYAITSNGGVIRTKAKQVRKAGRQTKGVRLMNLSDGDTLIAIARNADEQDDEGAADQD